MKRIITISFCCLLNPAIAQEVPQWYQELVEHKMGEWVAENTTYLVKGDSFSYYTEQWWLGSNGTDLHGLLRNDEEEVIWTFYQYYDLKKSKAILFQFGSAGIKGEGEIRMLNDSTYELKQQFSNLIGEKWVEIHRTTLIDEATEKSISYSVKEKQLKEESSYIWKKQSHIKL